MGGASRHRRVPLRVAVRPARSASRPDIDGAPAADRPAAGIRTRRGGNYLRRRFAHLAARQPPLQPGLAAGGGAARNPQRLDDRPDADACRPGLPGKRRPASADRVVHDGRGAAHRDGADRAGRQRHPDDPVLSLRRSRRAEHRHADLRAVGSHLRPGGCSGGRALQHRQHGGLRVVRGPDAGVRAQLQQHRHATRSGARGARSTHAAVRSRPQAPGRAPGRRARRAHPGRDAHAVPLRRDVFRARRSRAAPCWISGCTSATRFGCPRA